MSELIAQGKYKARATGIVYGESKEKKTPCMEVTVDLADDAGNSCGYTAYVSLWLSDGAIEYTNKKLAHIGFDGNFESPSWDVAKLFEVVCKHEEYNGKTRPKFDIWIPREAKPIPDDFKRTLAAKFKAMGAPPKPPAGKPAPFVATKPAPTPPPTSTPPPPPAPPTVPTTTIASAWDAVCAFGDGAKKTDEDIKKAWTDTVVIVADGRDQAAFTSEDWHRVQTNAIATLSGLTI